jgi:hypothetical protein
MKSAVELLAYELKKNHGIDLRLYDEFNQAKEMEKEQIKDAYENGENSSAELYYNETFKSE